MTQPSDRAMTANELLAAHALRTYRYLRLGIVAAVMVLFVGLVIERVNAGCLMTSISAYYYSPVRPLLVGGLTAIGLSLIAVRGRTNAEEVWLNLAGMFAPIVALVPTTPGAICPPSTSTDPNAVPGSLPDWAGAMVDNNVRAYFIVAGLAVVLLLGWWVLFGRHAARRAGGRSGTGDKTSWFLRSVLIYGGLVAVGTAGYLTSDRFQELAHWLAAVAMFTCFFFVVFGSARRLAAGAPAYAAAYRWIWRAMIAAAVVIGGWRLLDHTVRGFPAWDHAVYWLEVAQIFLFALFWGIQTWQFRAAAFPGHAGRPNATLG